MTSDQFAPEEWETVRLECCLRKRGDLDVSKFVGFGVVLSRAYWLGIDDPVAA